MEIRITVPGKPVGKGRPRFGNGFTYTPKKTVEYENLVRFAWMQKGADKLSGKLRAVIVAHFPIPKGTSKKKRASMDGTMYDKKPDCDNIAKIILDALNGIAYDDDAQVALLSVVKIYDSDESKVEILLAETEAEYGNIMED